MMEKPGQTPAQTDCQRLFFDRFARRNWTGLLTLRFEAVIFSILMVVIHKTWDRIIGK